MDRLIAKRIIKKYLADTDDDFLEDDELMSYFEQHTEEEDKFYKNYIEAYNKNNKKKE